jgi:hypothetical protein
MWCERDDTKLCIGENGNIRISRVTGAMVHEQEVFLRRNGAFVPSSPSSDRSHFWNRRPKACVHERSISLFHSEIRAEANTALREAQATRQRGLQRNGV